MLDAQRKIIDCSSKRFYIDTEQGYHGEIGGLEKYHRRWSRWATDGVWQQVFSYLASDADNEYGMIDSTIIRAHQQSAGAIKKRMKIKPLEEVEEDGVRRSMQRSML